jgi:hypothetical protein
MDNQRAHEKAKRWDTYVRVETMRWRISIAPDGRVSFLAPCEELNRTELYVNSRYNSRAGVMALGRLLGVLLAILRRQGPASLPEVSFDPESPGLGMVSRHMAKNPYVLRAFQDEGLYLIGLSDESIRFRRYSRQNDNEGR